MEPEPLLTTARCSGVLIRIIQSFSLEVSLLTRVCLGQDLLTNALDVSPFGGLSPGEFYGSLAAQIGLNRSLLEPGPCSWTFHWFFAVVINLLAATLPGVVRQWHTDRGGFSLRQVDSSMLRLNWTIRCTRGPSNGALDRGWFYIVSVFPLQYVFFRQRPLPFCFGRLIGGSPKMSL